MERNDGTIARYDSQNTAGFKDASSWETFDVATLPGAPKGFATAAFDGRYLYLAPYYNGAYHGTIARYDTHGAFARESWETFDLTTINATAKGFLGSVFDGRYIYLVPYAYFRTATMTYMNNTVMRFDTRAGRGLADANSWASHKSPAVGYHSGAFDGRYVYFVQFYTGTAYGGIVARVDTKADFTSDSSWSAVNVATFNGSARGFVGATFDGQYLYLVPYATAPGTFSGLAARFDTTADFAQKDSWKFFDMKSAVAGAIGYYGAGFDGRYVYFVPNRNSSPNGLVMRFDAKSPPWLPLHWNGSFN